MVELLPCPFCGGAMQFRKALWPSDGNVDSVIHAGPSDCGMVYFETGTIDESVIAAWNRRATPPGTQDAVERAAKAFADATGYYVEFHPGLSSPSADKLRAGMRAALAASGHGK